MDFKEYLKEEEERVDEIIPVIAAIGGGIAKGASVVGRGLVGGAKAAAGSAKQFMVKRAKKKAIKRAGEVAQNVLAPEEQQAEGYTTGGPGTGERVGKYIEKAGYSPGGFTKKKQKQVRRIFRKVVTKKTKSTGRKTPSGDKQRKRAKHFITTLGHDARGGMGIDARGRVSK